MYINGSTILSISNGSTKDFDLSSNIFQGKKEGKATHDGLLKKNVERGESYAQICVQGHKWDEASPIKENRDHREVNVG